MADLTATRHDTRTLTLTLDGDAVFASGDFVWFTAKHQQSDPDDDAVIAKHTGGGGITYTVGENTATLTLEPADTTNLTHRTTLVYDWQILTDSGNLWTVDHGTFTVEPDITKATTAPA